MAISGTSGMPGAPMGEEDENLDLDTSSDLDVDAMNLGDDVDLDTSDVDVGAEVGEVDDDDSQTCTISEVRAAIRKCCPENEDAIVDAIKNQDTSTEVGLDELPGASSEELPEAGELPADDELGLEDSGVKTDCAYPMESRIRQIANLITEDPDYFSR